MEIWEVPATVTPFDSFLRPFLHPKELVLALSTLLVARGPTPDRRHPSCTPSSPANVEVPVGLWLDVAAWSGLKG